VQDAFFFGFELFGTLLCFFEFLAKVGRGAPLGFERRRTARVSLEQARFTVARDLQARSRRGGLRLGRRQTRQFGHQPGKRRRARRIGQC